MFHCQGETVTGDDIDQQRCHLLDAFGGGRDTGSGARPMGLQSIQVHHLLMASYLKALPLKPVISEWE